MSEPPREDREPAPAWTVDAMGQLRVLPEGPASGVQLGGILGEGGMGLVRAATQRSLGRDVAVKTLRPERAHATAAMKLLREALITGSLEHPNIVPVYDLGLDDTGAPMLVLKRISGVAWNDLLERPEAVTQRFGSAEPLEWHLRTLMQVCSAIHFAHKRGIIHRDIKPENVMVGEFGEVYVLDWGIAVATHDDGSHRFPLAEESTDLSGTPVYMAPEMFDGQVADVRTDVYLLGATLYHVVAGRPPHLGSTMVEVLANTLSPPKTPEGAPPDLEAIWLKAMAHARSDRYATAEEMRLAIQAYLDHRASRRLAERAARSLEELEKLVARAEGREALYEIFGECTFGFKQALAEWPENEAAKAGLRAATICMARYEIGQEDARAGRLLLAKLDPPDEALLADIDRLEARALRSAERVRALERLGQEMDPNAGIGGRKAILVLLGTLWVVVPLLVSRFYRSSPDYASLFPVPTTMFLVVVVSGWVARRSMMRTRLNRTIVGAAALAFFAQMTLHVGSYFAGVSPDESQRFILFVWFVIAAMMAVAVAPRVAVAAAAYLGAYLAASKWFELRYELMAAANAVLMVTLLSTFGPKAKTRLAGASLTSVPPKAE
ncbi:MAG: protein kinase [Deltaproteobacteria bacterium]|nr:protein kinase [Deltaproteobacteria bacterium]